jgi:hypothetical protein
MCPILACTHRDSPFHRILLLCSTSYFRSFLLLTINHGDLWFHRIHRCQQVVSFLCQSRDSRHPYLHMAACPEVGGLSSVKIHREPATLSFPCRHLARPPRRGCQLPDAILHGKRSFRPHSRAVQRLAVAELSSEAS